MNDKKDEIFSIETTDNNLVAVCIEDFKKLCAANALLSNLVKTVDPDNLPSNEVWAWCEEGLYLGRIDWNHDHEGDEYLVILAYHDKYSNPTHYIEQSDLIEVFNNAK